VRDKLQPESSLFKELQKTWTPFFNGVTTFYETINIDFRLEQKMLPGRRHLLFSGYVA